MYTVLVCDDEKDIVSALTIYLSAEGYRVLCARDGAEALRIFSEEDVHLVLMDIMMPRMNGVEATAKLRAEHNVPIILLTAKGENTDKVLGLNVGADDYVVKPFDPVELLARVRAQLRRYATLGGMAVCAPEITVGAITLRDADKTVIAYGAPVALTPKEYDILHLLMRQPGRVFSSHEIYRAVWKEVAYGAENTVAVHIRHLREKLEINPADPRHVKVVWGQGYKIERGME